MGILKVELKGAVQYRQDRQLEPFCKSGTLRRRRENEDMIKDIKIQ